MDRDPVIVSLQHSVKYNAAMLLVVYIKTYLDAATTTGFGHAGAGWCTRLGLVYWRVKATAIYGHRWRIPNMGKWPYRYSNDLHHLHTCTETTAGSDAPHHRPEPPICRA